MAAAERHRRRIAVAAIGPAFSRLVGAAVLLAVATINVAILDTVTAVILRAIIAVPDIVAVAAPVVCGITVAQLAHPEVTARQRARQLEPAAGPGLDSQVRAVVSDALGDLARGRLPAEYEVDGLDEIGLPGRFVEIVNAILPLLDAIAGSSVRMGHFIDLEEGIASEHPRELLDLLWKVLPEDAWLWPYETRRTLDALKAQELIRDDTRLAELSRREQNR